MTDAGSVDLSVVIPVYGRFELLDLCLESVRRGTTLDYEIVVVDDASPGGPPSVNTGRVIERGENGGFAKAANTGLAVAKGRHVAFLNSDAQVPPGWDLGLVEALSDGVGLAAAVQTDDAGQVTEAGTIVGPDGHVALGDRLIKQSPDQGSISVPAVGAACVVARRVDLKRWGGFSERYGRGYYEDIDLSLTVGSAGLRCVVVPQVRVVHSANSSFDEQEVALRLRFGRAVLTRKWRNVLRHRPSIHGWEALPSREAFACSYGRAGRAIVVVSDSTDAEILIRLDRDDVAIRSMSVDDAAAQLSHIPHWADVVIGSDADVSAIRTELDEYQPRAPHLSSGMEPDRLALAWQHEGLGRSIAADPAMISAGDQESGGRHG